MRIALFAPLALAVFCVAGTALAADDDSDLVNKLINEPSVTAWSVGGVNNPPKPFDDAGVQGGRAIRVAVSGKGANVWDVAARMPIKKPIAKGDTVLLAFWARAEVPAEGQKTAILPGIRLEQTSAPYGAFAQDSTQVDGTWTMVYASGIADQDYAKGTLEVAVHLAAARQTVDLGPALVFDFGQNYDQSKLPHNALAAAAPMAAPAAPTFSPEQAGAKFADVAKLRARLPVPGRLMNDPSPSVLTSYGPNQTSQLVAAPDVPGGQALRVDVTSGGGETYAVGSSSQLAGDIHKGDVVFFAFYARAAATSDGQPGVIAAMNVQQNMPPWTVLAGTSAQAPLNSWRLFYGSGVAPSDIPSGGAVLSGQIGGRKQTIDFGPAFVFDLGPEVNVQALPAN